MNKPLIETLAWDSEFFGFGVGQLNAASLQEMRDGIAFARRQKLTLLYWAVDSQSALAESAKSTHSQFVIDTVLFERDLIDVVPEAASDRFQVIPYGNRVPNQQLIELAVAAGSSSRFKLDPRFTDEQFLDLYKVWIQNSCNQKIADTVLTAVDPNMEIVGLVTVQVTESKATIGLISVLDRFRGQGVASRLMQSAMKFSNEQRCETVRVRTQLRNEVACSLYRKMDFSIKKSDSWFHIWVKSSSFS